VAFCIDKDGYGRITYDGKRVFTHRLSFKVVMVTGHDLSAYILVIILHVSILGIFSRERIL